MPTFSLKDLINKYAIPRQTKEFVVLDKIHKNWSKLGDSQVILEKARPALMKGNKLVLLVSSLSSAAYLKYKKRHLISKINNNLKEEERIKDIEFKVEG